MGEYAIVNDYNANKLPDTVNDEQGAMIEPAAVALYGVERAKVGGGSTVLITGAGPIGALCTLAAAALGASKIFVSEPNPNRRRQIEALGVTTRVVDPRSVNVVEMLREETEEGVESTPPSNVRAAKPASTPASRRCATRAPSPRSACT